MDNIKVIKVTEEGYDKENKLLSLNIDCIKETEVDFVELNIIIPSSFSDKRK